MAINHLENLRAEAQHARQRYQLYKAKAKAYGPPTLHVCASSNASARAQRHVSAQPRLRSGAPAMSSPTALLVNAA